MVFTREPTSMLGTTEESKAWIAATAADTMAQIAQGRPEGGSRDAEAKTSRGGLEVSQDDAPNRDMTHKAPSSPVRSTDMVFTRKTNIHAKDSGGRRRHPRPEAGGRHPAPHKGGASRGPNPGERRCDHFPPAS